MKWLFGSSVLPGAVTLTLLLQFSAVFFILYHNWGWLKATSIFIVVAIATWSSEFIGSSTGFPFGSYSYTEILQPQLAHVPLLIPIAWFMMLPSAWAVAELIAGRGKPAAYIVISALAITAWDLFLDPQMVAWGFWIWDSPGGYFGIPWTNYIGWLLTAGVVTLLIRPYRLKMPILPLVLIYGIVWFLQSVGLALFWAQPGPALAGMVAMGILWFFALYQYRRRRAL